MTKKAIGFCSALALLVLAAALLLTASAPAASQEIAAIQKAIAKEKLEWQAGVTSLSALPRAERRLRLGGRLSEIPAVERIHPQQLDPGALPSTLDWRNHGGNWISSVKDQGSCGSCWAFSATALLEAMVKITKHVTDDTNLSEQMLVSCSGAGTCDGGWAHKAAAYIKATGIPRETCFPYTANDAACHPCSTWATQAVRITSWSWVGSSSSAIMTALQDGPVSTWMAVYDDLYNYKSGVYQPTAGAHYEGGHFVNIIGYSQSSQYWICKNSWGKNWGEDGFFRIKWGTSGIGQDVIRMTNPIVNNKAPVLQGIPNCSGEEGQAIAFTIHGTDADGDPLTYGAVSLPANATVDAASGAFAWTPSFSQAGTYTIRFRVSDGVAEDTQNVVITVANVKHVQW